MVSRFIAKYPIVKTMGAYFCINIAADFNEQIFIKKRNKETYDRGKTARIAATCTFVTSPMLFVWIRFIDKLIPGKAAITVVKKVVADAFIFAPTVISTFYITTNILERKKDLTAEWKQKFFRTWSTGLCYWPFIQTVNFAIIPMKYKTCLYMPTASFIWMNYLCFMKDQKVVCDKEEEYQTHVPLLPSHELVPKTFLKSSTTLSKMPMDSQMLPSHKDISNTDGQTKCDMNKQCSQTVMERDSIPSSFQQSKMCFKSPIALNSDPIFSEQPWWPVHSDLFMSFIIFNF